MSVFEMSIDDLPGYYGRNPRPDDFDAFWADGLDELARTSSDVEFIARPHPANFVEAYDLYFTGVRGARIYAKYLRPRGITPSGAAVLMFHGYFAGSGDWFDKLAYVAQGHAVLAMDCRGQGGRSEDRGGVLGTTVRGHVVRGLGDGPHNLLFRHIFLDTVRLAVIAAGLADVDPARIGAYGASQGGGLALACAALMPSISRVVALYPFLCDYQRVWEMDLAVDAYAELKEYFRRFDPRHEQAAETFRRLGYIDVQHLADRVTGHVTMLTGLMDTVCPPSAQYAAYNRIAGPKSVIHYPDFEHETLPNAADIAFESFAQL
jgi:cephalosporin-C deacetylase